MYEFILIFTYLLRAMQICERKMSKPTVKVGGGECDPRPLVPKILNIIYHQILSLPWVKIFLLCHMCKCAHVNLYFALMKAVKV